MDYGIGLSFVDPDAAASYGQAQDENGYCPGDYAELFLII
jgi:hypothetical protein